MECAEIRDALLARDIPSGPRVDEHVAGCAACRELLAEQARLGALLSLAREEERPSPPDFGELGAALGEEQGVRAWLRSRSSIVRTAVSIWSLLLVLTVVVLTRPRADWALYPALRLNVLFALFGLGAFVAIELALRGPLRRARLGSALFALFGLGVPVVAALLPRAHVLHDASLQGKIQHFGERAGACFSWGLLTSAPLAILLYLFNREDRFSKLTAALAGAAAGLGANLTLHAHCAITDPYHLLVAHAALAPAWLLVFLGVARFSRAR